MPRRLIALTAAFLATLVAAPSAQAATAAYPDLQTLPPRDLQLDRASVDGDSRLHNVLRFSNTTWNAGDGPLSVGGTIDPAKAQAPAVQKVFNDDGSTAANHSIGTYTIHVEHQHYHYDDWGRYELWTKAAYDKWVADGRPAAVGPDLVGKKTTSCILDEEFIATLPRMPYPARYPLSGCDPTKDNRIDSGLSVGWGDTYDNYRYEQWIDLNQQTLADGDYVLRSVADPFNKVHESPGKSDPSRESVTANEGVTPFRMVGGKLADLHRPSGTVRINDIDAQTTYPGVHVRVLGRDDVSGVDTVRLSNDGITWRELPYGGSGSAVMGIDWDLTDTRYGGSTQGGVRTVYAQFRDRSGKWSASETDTIEYTNGTGPPPPPPSTGSQYSQAMLASNPTAWWRLGEPIGATTAQDVLGAHPGTYSSGVALGAPGLLNSDSDKAARFGGAGSVRLPVASGLGFTNAVTAEAWIKPDAIPAPGDWASVITRPEAYSLQFNGPLLEFTIMQNGARRRLQAPAGAVVAGQRYHVMGTYDGASHRLYINGMQVATASLTGPISTGNGLNIGSWGPSTEYFKGTIDEAAVYGAALTGLDAKRHYDAGIATVAGVATPSGLTATAASGTRVDLAWVDNSGNETKFVIQRSTSSAFTSPTSYEVGADVKSYADNTATAGTTYWYRVRAESATEQSAWSAPASVTTPAPAPTAPAAPTNLAATAQSTSSIGLTWTDNATNETGYRLERSTSSAFTTVTATTLAANATSATVSGLEPSTTYWFRLRAENGTVVSAWSGSASATTQAVTPPPPPATPAAPSGLTATAPSSTSVSLSWADNATNETAQVLERSTSSAFTAPTRVNLAANATTYTDATAAAATSYWYRVRADNGTAASAWSNVATVTTPAAPPTGTPSYADAVTADTPVSWWRLGELSGTVAGDARGANPGTYRNAPLLGSASLLTRDTANRAAGFDGGDWAEVPDKASLDLTTAVTLEAWIKPQVVPAIGGWASVVSKSEAYSLQFNGPRLEFTLIQNGVRRRLQTADNAIVAGRTYHVVGTYDGTTQRLYVNGTQVGSRAQTGLVTATNWPLTIASWSGGERFTGVVDEVAVYDKALTAARVSAHTQAGGLATATAAARRVSRAGAVKPRGGRYAMGPAQRRTFGRKGPGAPRTLKLPKR